MLKRGLLYLVGYTLLLGGLLVLLRPICLGVMFPAALVLFWMAARDLQKFFRFYDTLKTRRSQAVAERAMSASEQELADQLQALGFAPLGVVQAEGHPYYSWLFHNPDFTILAEAIFTRHQAVRFSSWFGERTLIETRFPNGERITEPMFRTTFTAESIPAAYQIHLNAIHLMNEMPHPLQTVAEALEWEIVYRQHYIVRAVRRNTTVKGLQFAFWAYVLLFTALLIPVYRFGYDNFLTAYLVAGIPVMGLLHFSSEWLGKYRGR